MSYTKFRAPALPLPSQNYSVEQQSELIRALRLYFNLLDSRSPQSIESVETDYIDFNTTATFTSQKGRMGWNDTDQTVDIGMDYGSVLQVGQEMYARVANNTGSTIPNGTVVGFAGATANALYVTPYLADGSQPSLYILGVMTHDLPDSGDRGYCSVWGFVRDVDTSAFSAGDVLYASPSVAGAFTNVKPTSPDNVIPVAACVVSDATNGVIFVRPTIQQQQDFGRFTKTDNQSAALINTAYPITFTTTDVSSGVSIGSPTSRIVVSQSGYYQFDSSFQLSSTNASAKNFRTWIRKNGTDVTNSSRIVTVDINNGYSNFSITRNVSLNANEYVEFMFSVTDTAMSLSSSAATAWAPGAPAVFLAVAQIEL